MQNTYSQIFNHKKVLVTGHTGFKGSWLSAWLHLLGAEVYGVSLDSPPSSTDTTEFVVPRSIPIIFVIILSFN